MKKFIFIFLTAVECIILQAQTLTGRVVRIADGDTFTLLVEKKQHRIRLYGVDAPETKGGQPYSQKAKDYLASMIAGRTVQVEVKDTDRYGRYLGVVSTTDIKDVNLDMIRSGMAWHYSYYDNTTAYKSAQQQAQKGRKGLWRDPSPINPYDWRKSHKK